MTTFRSKVPPAKRSDYVFLVEAAYGVGDRPVCSLCWSKLDYKWGKGRDRGHRDWIEPLLEGKVSEEEWVDENGESWLVWEEIQRCCNPDCDGAVVHRYLPAKLSYGNPYHPGDIKANKIKAAKYKKGKYGDDGVFRIDGKPIKLPPDTKGVKIAFAPPWAYIDPGEFIGEIPDQWTVNDGIIKTNSNSNRFTKIVEWFAARRIMLLDLAPEDSILPTS